MREVSENYDMAKKVVHNDFNSSQTSGDIMSNKINNDNYSVLLVEDNLLAQQVNQRYLNKFNCQVDLAIDAETALKLVGKNNYNLILMDIGLPDGDGRDVTRTIRDSIYSLNRVVPIVAVTAHALELEQESCLNAGMNGVFSKPLTSQVLERILSTFIQLDKQQQDNIEAVEIVENEIIDTAKVAALLGNEDDAKAVVAELVAVLPKERKAIIMAYEAKQWDELKRLLHKLQGGVSYCGTKKLQTSCHAMENALQQNKYDLTTIEMHYRSLLQEIATVIMYYQQYLN